MIRQKTVKKRLRYNILAVSYLFAGNNHRLISLEKSVLIIAASLNKQAMETSFPSLKNVWTV